MTRDKPAFDLSSSIENDQAALYFGHLAAQAESAFPNADRMAQVSLCWAAAHVIADKSRKWSITLEGIENEGRKIGTWGLTARVSQAPQDTIEIARRSWLISDGRKIIELLSGFEDNENKVNEVSAQAIEMASLSVILKLRDLRSNIAISDRFGRTVTFKARPSAGHTLKNLTFFRSIINSL
jgi:hypothetical protein